MSSRVCKLHPDRFCYVCGKIVQLNRGFPLTKPLQEAYLQYFGFPVSNQDKNWVPHVICTNCRLVLSSWYSGKNRSLKFGKPMMKNFTKALDKSKPAFQYLGSVFTNLSAAKLKEDKKKIFVGPQIRRILDDTKFESLLTDVEKAAWNSFKSVVKNF